jgi:hypothetical protein
MNFHVKHPQLEFQPGEYREGLKRYKFHKNMNSYDYPEILRPANVKSSFQPNPSASIPEIQKLRQKLLEKQQEIDKLKSMAESTSRSYNGSPIGINLNEANQGLDSSVQLSSKYNLFELSKLPAFQQPKFTKRNPKVINTSTITGYKNPIQNSLGHYGNMIIGSKKPFE